MSLFLSTPCSLPLSLPRRLGTVRAYASTLQAPSNHQGSLYQVLRVEHTASPSEIKTAYRTLAKVYHPDSQGRDQDFIDIHNAYATLHDPAARALYDLSMGGPHDLRSNRSSSSKFQRPTRRWETDQCW